MTINNPESGTMLAETELKNIEPGESSAARTIDIVDDDNTRFDEGFHRASLQLEKLCDDDSMYDVSKEPPYNVDFESAEQSYLDNPQYWRAIFDRVDGLGKNRPEAMQNEGYLLTRIASLVPYFMYVASDLELRKESMSPENIRSAKEYASRFNTALREYIDKNPGMSQSHFVDALADHAQHQVRPQYSEAKAYNKETSAKDLIKKSVDGVAQEYAFESIMLAVGVKPERGNMDDDLEGTDYIVDSVKIDVKRSLASFKDKTNNLERRGGDTWVFCPLILKKNYSGGTFRIDEDVIKRRSDQYRQMISNIH